MKKLLWAFICVIMSFSLISCGKDLPDHISTEDIKTQSSQMTETTEAERTETKADNQSAEKGQTDRFGYGLADSGIFAMNYEKPAFSSGIAVRETYLFPAPSEKVYELGVIYQGRAVNILYSIDVKTFEEYDLQEPHEDYAWYLVETEGLSTLGFVRAEDIAEAGKTIVETTEPYQIKPGGVFYNEASCRTPCSEDYAVGPLVIKSKDESAGVLALEGPSGLWIYIKDPEVLEPWPYIGSKRVSHGS